MLTNKQIRMLELLDEQVRSCKRCQIYKNGCVVPYWTPNSRFAIIGEAPGYNQVKKQIPFSGAAGKIIIDILIGERFVSDDFFVINSVQCRANNKPTFDELYCCQDFIRKYLKVINPEKILCLGNYSKYIFTHDITGVLSQRGKFNTFDIGDGFEFPVLYTIHPAYCIYNQEEGLPMLRKDIKFFKKAHFQRKSDWYLNEDDFKL